MDDQEKSVASPTGKFRIGGRVKRRIRKEPVQMANRKNKLLAYLHELAHKPVGIANYEQKRKPFLNRDGRFCE